MLKFSRTSCAYFIPRRRQCHTFFNKEIFDSMWLLRVFSLLFLLYYPWIDNSSICEELKIVVNLFFFLHSKLTMQPLFVSTEKFFSEQFSESSIRS